MEKTTVEELTDLDFEASLKANPISVVDLYATWCGSCRLFAPIYATFATEHPEFRFYKADAEKNPKLRAAVTGIDNLPFIAVFHEGQFVGGKTTSKKEALEEMMNVIREKLKS